MELADMQFAKSYEGVAQVVKHVISKLCQNLIFIIETRLSQVKFPKINGHIPIVLFANMTKETYKTSCFSCSNLITLEQNDVNKRQ